MSINNLNHLEILIQTMARRILRLYQQKQYYTRNDKQYKSRLVHFGLLEHGGYNTDTNKDSTVSKRLRKIELCIRYQNGLVSDALDLRERFIMYDFMRNKTSYTCLQPKFELIFIKQQSILNELLHRDVDYGCALVMAGILNDWTNRQWEQFNLYV